MQLAVQRLRSLGIPHWTGPGQQPAEPQLEREDHPYRSRRLGQLSEPGDVGGTGAAAAEGGPRSSAATRAYRDAGTIQAARNSGIAEPGGEIVVRCRAPHFVLVRGHRRLTDAVRAGETLTPMVLADQPGNPTV